MTGDEDLIDNMLSDSVEQAIYTDQGQGNSQQEVQKQDQRGVILKLSDNMEVDETCDNQDSSFSEEDEEEAEDDEADADQSESDSRTPVKYRYQAATKSGGITDADEDFDPEADIFLTEDDEEYQLDESGKEVEKQYNEEETEDDEALDESEATRTDEAEEVEEEMLTPQQRIQEQFEKGEAGVLLQNILPQQPDENKPHQEEVEEQQEEEENDEIMVREDQPSHEQIPDVLEEDEEQDEDWGERLKEKAKRFCKCDRDPVFQEDLKYIESRFPAIKRKYKLLEVAGEGTFGTVFKAFDINHYLYEHDWCENHIPKNKREENAIEICQSWTPCGYVAIKFLLNTSSYTRMKNELDLLRKLDHPNVIKLLGVEVATDIPYTEAQTLAIFPYIQYTDFKKYYRKMTFDNIKNYMRSLMKAVVHIHSMKIIHRDIKPCNFLFNTETEEGVLIDFGLSEIEERKVEAPIISRKRPPLKPNQFYDVKTDKRPTYKAERAGTRGFRSPEVLFKVENQTTALDMWAAGCCMLIMLTGRYPFFHSESDVDGVIEIAAIFGIPAMKKVAQEEFGRTFETNVNINRHSGFSWKDFLKRYCAWRKDKGDLCDDGIDLLSRMLCLSPRSRITASEALDHPFLKES